jgi:glycerate kinase
VKIVIAPDSFKGTNSALNVARAIERGIRRVAPDVEAVIVPIADGGEGTVEAVLTAAGGELREVRVVGPLGEERGAQFGVMSGGRAVIEMAAASGLPLVPEEKRNPLVTTTYGTGQLIRAALDAGCRELLIGIGGSATNDGGMGMAQALGASFRDASGRELAAGGAELARLADIDVSGLDPRLREARVTVACDVDNPLCGERGASAIYGPQKGATAAMIRSLDAALGNYASVIGRRLARDVAEVPGAGAAGGLGAGLMVFAGGKLTAGIDAILDIVRFDTLLDGVDLVITGEGKLDAQTAFGKVPVGVARRVRPHGIPVIAIAGDIGKGSEAVYAMGIRAVVSTVDRAMPLAEALAESRRALEDCGERVMRLLSVGRDLAAGPRGPR